MELPSKERNMKDSRLSVVLAYVVFALCLFLTIGSISLFHGCGPKDDGSFMRCHWAETMIFAMGIVLSVISLFAAIVKDKGVRVGALASMVPCLILTMLVPGTVIKLCMMQTMRCWTVMRPSVVVISIVILIVVAVDIISCLGKENEASKNGAAK